jgi:hypothetical protein
MTKTHLLCSPARGNHVADLDVAVRDDDAINQELFQLPLLRKRRCGKALLDTPAEILAPTGQGIVNLMDHSLT